jgi:uncharacterized protein involved in exopolysaccharide biosynthesis
MTAGAADVETTLKAGRLVRAGRPEGPREETSLLAFFSILLAHRRKIALCALLGLVLFGAFAATEADRYVSGASFVVKSARSPVQLPGGAAALGISLAAFADFSQSVSFYADLGRSGVILRKVALKGYFTTESRGVKRPLADILGIRDRTPELAANRAAAAISNDVTYTISSRTGVVRMSVEADDPLVAQQLVANIVSELDAWSKTRGHEQAVMERRFIEQQLAEAKANLDQAEQAERNFLEMNRDYASSPQLSMEDARLLREVIMRQEIYTSLGQSLEQAKIEELRSPTILNVIETADLPVEPQRREALRTTLIGLAVGLLVGIVLAMLSQRVEEKKAFA